MSQPGETYVTGNGMLIRCRKLATPVQAINLSL